MTLVRKLSVLKTGSKEHSYPLQDPKGYFIKYDAHFFM